MVREGPYSGQRLGEFELAEVLGSGGMGVVYRGRSTSGTDAAVKIVVSLHDQGLRRRFAREAGIRLDHPNIVRVLAAGQANDGAPFIAFELLEGDTVDDLITERRLSIDEIADIGVQTCAGLACAHAKGIIHRDLKPANLFRTRDGTVKVLDFGVARIADEARITRTGLVVGTPAYLGPEQAQGDGSIDHRADLWSLGAVLYHALTQQPPFARDSTVATMLAAVMDELPPVRTIEPDVPPAFAGVVERALAKNPWRRWQSAEAMGEALRGVDLTLVDRPTPAHAPTVFPAGEQRVVAVLYAEAIDRIEPLRAAVEDRGGTLVPLIGRCAIGLFGGAVSEGDESSRAVAAGLMSRHCAGRMAVCSGRAESDGAAISGSVVDAAQQACSNDVSGVALDTATARSLSSDFSLLTVAGGMFEAVRYQARSASSLSTARGAVALTVGREAELAQMKRALRTALDDDTAQVVVVSGPPGIGKSHLSREMDSLVRREAEVSAEPIRVIAARTEPHHRKTAFSLLTSLVRHRAARGEFDEGWPSLDPGAPEAERFEAVERLTREAIVGEQNAKETALFLAELLGIEAPASRILTASRSDPRQMQDRLRMALQDYLRGLCDAEPLVLLLEDVHWADDASLAIIDDLLEQYGDAPLLVFATTRTEIEGTRATPFADHDVITIEPRPLGKEDVAAMAEAIANQTISPALTAALVERSGGNPLFVEQIVRDLGAAGNLDAPPAELPLPLTIEAAVQSRLDHLPPLEKDLLKRASVYDRPFSVEELAVVGVIGPLPLLRSLRGKELIASGRRAGRVRGFRFRTQIVADVAYGLLAPTVSADLHRTVAEYLGHSGRAPAEEVAGHFERADQTSRAAQAYAEAALAHAGRADGEAVLRCADRALQLGVSQNMQFNLHMARAETLEYSKQRTDQAAALEQAEQVAQSAAELARVQAEQAFLLSRTGRAQEGLATAEDALAAARRAGDEAVLARALGRAMSTQLYAGKFDDAARAVAQMQAITSQVDLGLRAMIAGWSAQYAAQRGDLGERRSAFEQAERLYRDSGDLRRAAGAATNLADALNRIGAYDEAVVALGHALEACRRVGNRPMEGYALANLGYAHGRRGALGAALEALDKSAAVAQAIGESRLAVAVQLYRAQAMLGAVDPTEVGNLAEAAAVQANTMKLPSVEAVALAVAAQAWVEAGEIQRADTRSKRALAIRDELQGVEEDELIIFYARAKALNAAGEHAGATAVLERARTRLSELAAQISDPSWRARFCDAQSSDRDRILS